ncbi:MAG TPA: hypothetical protein PKE31_02405 [Pseudomonadota bacterium]|nr:hypothetical protein [Pseudomonadota bacterium]
MNLEENDGPLTLRSRLLSRSFFRQEWPLHNLMRLHNAPPAEERPPADNRASIALADATVKTKEG